MIWSRAIIISFLVQNSKRGGKKKKKADLIPAYLGQRDCWISNDCSAPNGACFCFLSKTLSPKSNECVCVCASARACVCD